MNKKQERDYKKYYVLVPDADFNPEKNKFVVEEAIRKTDEYKKLQRRIHMDNIRMRSEAVASYLTTEKGGARSGVDIEKYLGKRNLAVLRGEDLVNQLRRKSLITS